MIDPLKDTLHTISEACRTLPRRPSPVTAWRWRTKGVCIAGQRVRLECVRVGGQWYTTESAMAEFIVKQSKLPTVEDEQTPERSASTQKKL